HPLEHCAQRLESRSQPRHRIIWRRAALVPGLGVTTLAGSASRFAGAARALALLGTRGIPVGAVFAFLAGFVVLLRRVFLVAAVFAGFVATALGGIGVALLLAAFAGDRVALGIMFRPVGRACAFALAGTIAEHRVLGSFAIRGVGADDVHDRVFGLGAWEQC